MATTRKSTEEATVDYSTMISFSNMEANALLKTMLSEREIRVLGEPLGEWVSKCK